MLSATLYIKLYPAVTFTKPVDFFVAGTPLCPGKAASRGRQRQRVLGGGGGKDLVGRLSRALLWLQSGRRGWRVRVPKEGRRAGAPGTREP